MLTYKNKNENAHSEHTVYIGRILYNEIIHYLYYCNIIMLYTAYYRMLENIKYRIFFFQRKR